jgi:hypothetical protein
LRTSRRNAQSALARPCRVPAAQPCDCLPESKGADERWRTDGRRRSVYRVPSIDHPRNQKGFIMSSIVYIVGTVVIVLAVLSFFGLR